ncbi:hypothetical protein ACF0H5_005237 [Mactra antiquata]
MLLRYCRICIPSFKPLSDVKRSFDGDIITIADETGTQETRLRVTNKDAKKKLFSPMITSTSRENDSSWPSESFYLVFQMNSIRWRDEELKLKLKALR